ncbi:MAG: hypothetical protein L0287_20405, partial [Anaerolineae bacterium]|nr:hypothetical protein [Anaerolineae bacterium]MCI0609354.1 hypothetical protein [Anaerolineae bacterium]
SCARLRSTRIDAAALGGPLLTFAPLAASILNSLCATLAQDANWDTLLAIGPLPRMYSTEEFDNATLVIADFIDLVSPAFTGHSRNVAALVEASAQGYGLPASDVKSLWRAYWPLPIIIRLESNLVLIAKRVYQMKWRRQCARKFVQENWTAKP